jgi:hypothetical protein
VTRRGSSVPRVPSSSPSSRCTPLDPTVFLERVKGVRKLNLNHVGLGDIGALALAAMLLAAHRADEYERGRLRARQRKAAATARTIRAIASASSELGTGALGLRGVGGLALSV